MNKIISLDCFERITDIKNPKDALEICFKSLLFHSGKNRSCKNMITDKNLKLNIDVYKQKNRDIIYINGHKVYSGYRYKRFSPYPIIYNSHWSYLLFFIKKVCK